MSFKGVVEILLLNGKMILHHFWNTAGHCLVSPSKLEVSFLKIFKLFFQNALSSRIPQLYLILPFINNNTCLYFSLHIIY